MATYGIQGLITEITPLTSRPMTRIGLLTPTGRALVPYFGTLPLDGERTLLGRYAQIEMVESRWRRCRQTLKLNDTVGSATYETPLLSLKSIREHALNHFDPPSS